MPPKRYPLRVLRRPAAAARRAVRGAAQEPGPGERNVAVWRVGALRNRAAVAQVVGAVGQPAAPAAGGPCEPTRDLFDAWLSVVWGIRLLRLRIELGDPAGNLRAELARFETAKALCELYGVLGYTRVPRAAVQCLSERSQMSALRALMS